MKKYLLFAIIAACISIIIPYKAYSVEISLGATTCEAWIGRALETGDNLVIGPAFLYGPVLAVKFNEYFDITCVYTQGTFSEIPTLHDKMKMRDAQFAFGAGLNDYIKIIAGVRYMGFLFADEKYIAYGPELGFSATMPIVYKINIIASLTGFYLGGKITDGTLKEGYTEYGINGSLLLSYYIAPASVTVSIGRRLQYIKSDYYKRDTWIKSGFYGNMLTITYSFDI